MCCCKEVAKAQGTEVAVESLTDIRDVARCVVIDGQVVHVGSVPMRAAVEQWLSA